MIKSGTLRPIINESIEKKIVSKVMMLVMLTYCYYQIEYKTSIKAEIKYFQKIIEKIKSILNKHESKSTCDYYFEAVQVAVEVNQELAKDYLLSANQFDQITNLISGEYCYRGNYIKDSLFKLVHKKRNSTLSKNELKMYILENDKIEFILESLGCQKIRYVSNPKGDDYYKCTNPDGNNPEAVRVYINKYLNVTNFTRNYSDVADIFTLIQVNKGLDFGRTLIYVNQLLGLTKLTDSELQMLSIESNATKTKIDREAKSKKEKEKQEALARYKKALDNNRILYESAQPILTMDWFKEGIIEPTRRAFGIRHFDYDGKYEQIIFPIKDCNSGEVIAYQRRMIIDKDEEQLRIANGQPKYLVTEGYNKSKNVYGLWENKESIEKEKQLVIFESPKSVMKRWTFQDRTAVAIQGHDMSQTQRDIIGNVAASSLISADMECTLTGEINIPWHKTEVIIAFDKDISEETVLNTCDYLHNHAYSNGFNISYIIDKWGILKDKESPADVGIKKYKFLFDNRIKYNPA